MQKRNAAIAFAALALLVLAGAEATNAANQERSDRGNREHKGPSEEVRNAFESGDYDTWKELVSQHEKSPFATFSEDQFNRLQEAHKLRESGDKEGAKAIREELGLKKHPGKRGPHGDREHGNSEAREALESGNYAEWKELVSERENSPVADLTEDQFNKLREAHALREQGDHDAAKAIVEELGIKRPHDGNGFNRKGFHKNQNPEAREAIEAGDYEAFREALSGHEKALDNLTQEKFEEIVERFNNRTQNRQAPQQPQA